MVDHAGLLADGRGVAPAQHGADAGQQLTRAHRLGQVVVGAELEPDHPVDLFAHGAHDDDGRPRRGGDAAADRQAVFAREHDVQHDQIDRRGRKHAVQFLGVGGRVGLEPVARQVFSYLVSEPGVVLHDQDLGRGLNLGC